ncbi:uncharacterized protein LOC120344594 [Styela clava]
MEDPENEVIDEKEYSLASELRDLCSDFRKESASKLAQCADVLLKLGEIYLKKVDHTSGILQKLTYIRCSTLLNGAKVRFKLKNMEEEAVATEDLLQRMGIKVLQSACAHKTKDLVKISNKLFKRIKKFRMMYSSKVRRIPHLPEVGDEFFKSMKVFYVKELLQEVTDEYKSIMKTISEKCLIILGESPCDFAAVGLGSLARGEITPYSDFEHVLVLEDGVECRKDYKDIKEYFRWYSVLFQLIMINFGETFIRSVGIKSLNDLYSNDPEKNWFYDIFTPCGISFDGMAPHACGNPLGRQYQTEKCRHILELIKPSSEMAKLVNSTEDLNNGYYISELISRPCFVNGSQLVYDQFQSFVWKELEEVQRYKDVGKLISSNVLAQVRNNQDYFQKDKILNVKTDVYRPITVILSCHARVHSIRDFSSFRIIEDLFQTGVLSAKAYVEYRFALTIACEARMKVYVKYANQRHKIAMKTLLEIIGKPSFIEFYENMLLIRHDYHLCSELNLSKLGASLINSYRSEGFEYFGEKFEMAEARGLANAGLYFEAIQICPVIPMEEWKMYALFCEVCAEVCKDALADEAMLKICIESAGRINLGDSSIPLEVRTIVCRFRGLAEGLLGLRSNLNSTIRRFARVFVPMTLGGAKHFLSLLMYMNNFFGVKFDSESTLFSDLHDLIQTWEVSNNKAEEICKTVTLAKLMRVFDKPSEAIKLAVSARRKLRDYASNFSEEFVMGQLHVLIWIIDRLRRDAATAKELTNLVDITEIADMWTALGHMSENENKRVEIIPCNKIWCLNELGRNEEALAKCDEYLADENLGKDAKVGLLNLKGNTYILLSDKEQRNKRYDNASKQIERAIRLYKNMDHEEMNENCQIGYALAASKFFDVSLGEGLETLANARAILENLPDQTRLSFFKTYHAEYKVKWQDLYKQETNENCITLLHCILGLWRFTIARNIVVIGKMTKGDEILDSHVMIERYSNQLRLLEKHGDPKMKNVATVFLNFLLMSAASGMDEVYLGFAWIRQKPDVLREFRQVRNDIERKVWVDLFDKSKQNLSLFRRLFLLAILRASVDQNKDDLASVKINHIPISISYPFLVSKDGKCMNDNDKILS